MKILWSFLVTVACLFGATNLAAKAGAVDNGAFTAKDKEFYLTPEEILFIRPGLVVEILDVVIPADMQLEVTFSIEDSSGLPLDATGVYTPGVVDMRFTLANIPMGEEQKVRLAYERTSRNGTLTNPSPGMYTYKFDYVMDSDQDTTHTLVLGFRRDLRDFDLDRYAGNDLQDWVPSGMYDAVPRDIVATETCNRCHDPLVMHGDRWLTPAACDQCHNPTQNTRFDALIHATHTGGVAGSHDFSDSGIEYPVLPGPGEIECEVCHRGGTPTEAFPMVANPAAVLVCDASGLGETTLDWEYPGWVDITVSTPTSAEKLFASGGPESGSAATGKWVKDGTVFTLYDQATQEKLQSVTVNATVQGCIGNAPGDYNSRGAAGAQHTNWMDHTSRVVCKSCHEHGDVDFDTGEGHSEFDIIQIDDTLCGQCHQPGTGNEYDLSIRGSHIPVYKSAQMPGVLIDLISITDTDPGDYPTVTYSVSSKNGPLDPTAMNRVEMYFAGPNEDFLDYERDRYAGRDNTVPAGANWAWTSTTPIPADAEGSFTLFAGGRDYVDVDMGFGGIESERDNAENPMLAFAVTDETAMPRRTIVSDYNCENCHGNLNFHGGGRHQPDTCNFCHSPTKTGEDEANGGDVSIHTKFMVHSIHRGENLTKPLNVGGHDYAWWGEETDRQGNVSTVMKGVKYPGDLRNCEACHEGNTYQVPTSEGLLPTATPQWGLLDPMLPTTASCISCHDTDSAASHAISNTSFFGESCGTCHGEGKSYSVDKLHAR